MIKRDIIFLFIKTFFLNDTKQHISHLRHCKKKPNSFSILCNKRQITNILEEIAHIAYNLKKIKHKNI